MMGEGCVCGVCEGSEGSVTLCEGASLSIVFRAMQLEAGTGLWLL